MKTLVAGYGSIGTRHARILKELGVPVSVLSSREVDFAPRHRTLEEALAARPEYVVVAGPTADHFDFLCRLELAGFKGSVLVEKPLYFKSEAKHFSFKHLAVAYNLRFHPLLLRLKERLAGEKVLSVQCYVGKYLPEWRPQADYRKGYSASKSAGGGVLRDLSHELDYLNWMLGPWEAVTATGGHFSALELDSDDVFCLMLRLKKCPVATVQMNYVDRVSRREVLVNTDRHTFKADLIADTLEIDKEKETFKVERDDTYRAEHQAALSGQYGKLCSFEEGIDIMRLIDAAERASKEKMWVSR